MAVTYKATAKNTAWTAGTLATSSAINVAVGDLCVIAINTIDNTVWCTGLTDTAGNSYTIRTRISASYETVVFAWCVATIANANNIFTASFNNATATRKNITAAVYTIDVGDIVTLENAGSLTSDWLASPWTTGSAAFTGTDGIGICDVQGNACTYTNQEIPSGTAATAVANNANADLLFYRILSSPESETGEVDPSATGSVAMELLVFKSVAAAGVTLEQEGFRARNDDGNEAAATWLADQDTNFTRAKNLNTRLRMLLNATGDPPANAYRIECRKQGVGDFKKIN